MTYHIVFDISERIPDALMGALAAIGLVAIVTLSLRASWRSLLRRSSFVWLGTAALIWVAFTVHNLGGQYGIVTGGLGVLPLLLAVFAWQGKDLKLNDRVRPSARMVAPIVAAGLLGLLAYEGSCQWPAFDLDRQLAAGNVTVVTGTVQNAANWNWGSERFTVNGHQYSYLDSPTNVGFHQTAQNGGPIRNGLRVRVTSIGDVIVRLEIADGQ